MRRTGLIALLACSLVLAPWHAGTGVATAVAASVKKAPKGAGKRNGSKGDPKQVARAHFERAERAFSVGNFEQALIGYQAAHEALPLAAFLFNIGQCHRNLDQHERAVFFFQRYLALEPKAQNRVVVEELIGESERRMAAAQPAPASITPARPDLKPRPAQVGPERMLIDAAPEPQRRPSGAAPWWLWGALGAVVTGGLVAVLVSTGQASLPQGGLKSIDGRGGQR